MQNIANTNQIMKAPLAEAGDGFTRMELAATLAIVALLSVLLLSARAKARDVNLVAECAGNLRQVALALHLYGNENGDRLPSNGSGTWDWDLAWSASSAIAQYVAPGTASTNISWRVFYCPGTGWRFSQADNWRLWNYNPPSYRTLGYAMTLPNTASLNPTNVNAMVVPQPIQFVLGYLPAPSAARRVLVADATISAAGQNSPLQKSTYNWTSIKGGYSLAFTSPHLAGGTPAGCNAAMLDGHVEWHSPAQLWNRTIGGVPVFWW